MCKTASDVDIDSLAQDIALKGLLQPVIGAGDTDIDPVGRVDRGRGPAPVVRARALWAQGAIDDAWPVPVLMRSPAEAVDLSLSENLGKRDMNPADEFEAFATPSPARCRPADLPAAGFSERYVRQRLRLAELAPEILDAMASGEADAGGGAGLCADAGPRAAAEDIQIRGEEELAHGTSSISSAIINAQMTTGSAVPGSSVPASMRRRGVA